LDVPTSPSPTGQRAGRRAGLGGPPRHVGQRRRPPAGADDRRLQRVRRCCPKRGDQRLRRTSLGKRPAGGPGPKTSSHVCASAGVEESRRSLRGGLECKPTLGGACY